MFRHKTIPKKVIGKQQVIASVKKKLVLVKTNHVF